MSLALVLWCALVCHAVLCRVVPWCVLPWHGWLRRAVPCRAVLCCVVSWGALSWCIARRCAAVRRAVLPRVVPCFAVPSTGSQYFHLMLLPKQRQSLTMLN